MKKIIGRECKFVQHLPAVQSPNPKVQRDDTHVVKEVIHYSDGSLESKLRIVSNYKRPFWITKPHLRNHSDKKESEDLKRVTKYYSTESALGTTVASRLGGKYVGTTELRRVRDSPYLYGIDVSAKTYIKHTYREKYPNCVSDYRVAFYDTEVDTEKDELIIVSLVLDDNVIIYINKDFILNKGYGSKLDDRLKSNVKKAVIKKFMDNVEKTDLTKPIIDNLVIDTVFVENDLACITESFKYLHNNDPDLVSIWNINYDIPKILATLKRYGIPPEDVFSDPSLPENLRYFNYKVGISSKKTDSGKSSPKAFQDQWHTIFSPSKFWWIDGMCTYNFIRVGGKTVSGGFGLDNVLKHVLKGKIGKLKVEDEVSAKLSGVDWHKYMVKNLPISYLAYAAWDVVGMKVLDSHTRDLINVMPMLSMDSGFEIFNSGPKRLVDALHFFYLDRGRVIGCKAARVVDSANLGLSDWIALMPSHRIKERGKSIFGHDSNQSYIRRYVCDSDQAAGYPSNTIFANVSIDTTIRELLSIEGYTLDEFRTSIIDLFFGPINSIEFCTDMLKLPTLMEINKKILDK